MSDEVSKAFHKDFAFLEMLEVLSVAGGRVAILLGIPPVESGFL